jgi:hypothetical protein
MIVETLHVQIELAAPLVEVPPDDVSGLAELPDQCRTQHVSKPTRLLSAIKQRPKDDRHQKPLKWVALPSRTTFAKRYVPNIRQMLDPASGAVPC